MSRIVTVKNEMKIDIKVETDEFRSRLWNLMVLFEDVAKGIKLYLDSEANVDDRYEQNRDR